MLEVKVITLQIANSTSTVQLSITSYLTVIIQPKEGVTSQLITLYVCQFLTAVLYPYFSFDTLASFHVSTSLPAPAVNFIQLTYAPEE